MAHVDSRQTQLDAEGILRIGVENVTEYPVDLAYGAIIKEINLPGTTLFVAGNTLFIMHTTKQAGTAMFRPINSDVGANLGPNFKEFFTAAHRMGFRVLVSYPTADDYPIQILRLLKRDATNAGISVEIRKFKTDQFMGFIKLPDELKG